MAGETPEEAKKSAIHQLKAIGDSPLPPTLTATLIFALHAKPIQPLPLLFPPLLLLSTYTNLRGYKKDAGGMTAAYSALYMILAMRRKQRWGNVINARGVVRGLTLGLCAGSVVAGGVSWVAGRREDESHS